MLSSISCFLIKTYQKIPGPWHRMCRYYPSCSNYALEAIMTYGFVKGWYLSLKRIVRCNPWGGFGYDPVPKQNKKE